MLEVLLFQPMATMLVLPALCAPVNVTVTEDWLVCGVAAFTCTNAGGAGAAAATAATSTAFVTGAESAPTLVAPSTLWLVGSGDMPTGGIWPAGACRCCRRAHAIIAQSAG